jgi:sulfonate transport system substrate-binding protein
LNMMAKKIIPNDIKRILIRTAFALAVCACLFACSRSNQSAGPLEKVTIACGPPPYNTLMDIALAEGYIRREGLDATPHFYSTGKAALDEVLEGKADFATVAETPVMFAVIKGNKISIIATIERSNKSNAILARRDKGVHTPQDLIGKRIAVTLGTIGEYFLDAFLATHDMLRKDVHVVDMKPEKMPAALIEGVVDAASIFPPFTNQAGEKLGKNGVTFSEEDIYTQTLNLVATQEQIRRNPARVKKVLRALVEAEEFAAQDPPKAQDSVAAFRQTDKTTLGAVWGSYTFEVSLDQSLVLELEDESQWAIRNGLTGATKVPNYLNFIYLDGLAAVNPSAVRIVR